MRQLLRHWLTTIFILAPLTALAATPEIETATAGPKAIAMAPVLAPTTFSFENRGGMLDLLALPGYATSKGIEHSRVVELSNLLRTRGVRLGEEMTQALLDALKEAQIETQLMDNPARLPDDPLYLDYPKLQTDADLILTGVFDSVGFYSGRLSTKFLPRVNITISLVKRHNEEAVYSQSVYYGADARKPAEDQIPSDPKYAFASYDAAMAQPDELVQSLRDGIRQIAQLVVSQLDKVKR